MCDNVARIRSGSLDVLDVQARLNQFRELKDGWLDGEGVAPDGEGLDWLSDSFQRLYDAPLPFTYPMPSGGVQFEWSIGAEEISLEVDLASHNAVWHSLGLLTRLDQERELNLDSPADWEYLSKRIASAHSVCD